MSTSKDEPETTAPVPEVPDELVAERAHQKWIARGCPMGDGRPDWFDALDELRAEARAGRGPDGE